MKNTLLRCTLRIDQILLVKLDYIAKYEYRTRNKELEQLVKARIREFEAEHGRIELTEGE